MTEIVERILKESIEEINVQLVADAKLINSPDERLLGKTGKLDSMSFVTLVAIIEEKLQEHTGQAIYLVTDKAFAQKRSPFYDIQSLANFIDTLLAGDN